MARPRHVSDDEILEVAREVLTEDPSAPTTSIASRVGLSQAALFKRFGTKVGLIQRALDIPAAPDWTEVCERGPDDRPVVEQLHEIGALMNAFFQRIVPRVAALKALGLDLRCLFEGRSAPPPPVVGYQAMRGWVSRAMAKGLLRPADPAETAIAFMGSFQGRAFWEHVGGSWLPGPVTTDEAYVEHVVELFWRGLAPAGEGS